MKFIITPVCSTPTGNRQVDQAYEIEFNFKDLLNEIKREMPLNKIWGKYVK